jgi:hypothetical protein
MLGALKMTTTVLGGGRIELTHPQLPSGQAVDVIVLLPEGRPSGHSVVDVLQEAPGRLVFQTAEEVDTYLREERDSWER